jgi:hypothetical protein
MLGRLQMDVDECVTAYGNLTRFISSRESNQLEDDSKRSFTTLQDAITKALELPGRSSGDMFNTDIDHACRVFVLSHYSSLIMLTEANVLF